MASKTIWVFGGGPAGWAVRLDGRIVESGIERETALRRAHRLADFIEEGEVDAEVRALQADGSWQSQWRAAPYREARRWTAPLRRSA